MPILQNGIKLCSFTKSMQLLHKVSSCSVFCYLF
jgi:hypothetical protein